MMHYPSESISVECDASDSSTKTNPRLTVLLPAFNEAGGLHELLPMLNRELESSGMDYRVIVVDDGSSDDTAEVTIDASSWMPIILVRHEENRGLAAALRTAFAYALRGPAKTSQDIVVTMDSDNTHGPNLIRPMIQSISAGHDVVIASRFQPGAQVVGLSWFRHLTGVAAGLMFKLLFPIRGVRDYTCGYRAFRDTTLRRAMEDFGEAFISEKGFSCSVDILLKLARQRPLVAEVPLVLRYDLKTGTSKMPVGRTIFETLKLAAKRRLGIMR